MQRGVSAAVSRRHEPRHRPPVRREGVGTSIAQMQRSREAQPPAEDLMMRTAPAPPGGTRPARRRAKAKATDAVATPEIEPTEASLGESSFRRFAESSEDVFWLADLQSGHLLYVIDGELARGMLGFRGTPGHQFVGTVESIFGGVNDKLIGKRVVGSIICSCGKCDLCQGGLSAHCRHRTILGMQGRNGCLAERFTLPLKNLAIVPDAIDNWKQQLKN